MGKYHNYTRKCVTGIDYVQHSSTFARVMLGGCLGLRPFALDTAIETTIRGSFMEVEASQGEGEGGQGSRRNVPGTFFWTESINESSLTDLSCVLRMPLNVF